MIAGIKLQITADARALAGVAGNLKARAAHLRALYDQMSEADQLSPNSEALADQAATLEAIAQTATDSALELIGIAN
ncbi:hypothetical protein SAMN05444149_10877 [Pseudosulfitobacter pseudonitzschiae]|uniref:Uncharacterized protein n=1 Tax=Pseudosulfitobacter pseudonitzschiae TaxID=1402135 RepID=A0A073IUF2_9RHOB|nr:hypothetical protein [Pseudosulfitobacter pseudonitzschiae]KEJ93963.1 hypothetical protein SUH3_11870 [Pseudosulfitobacter pseudonitzschiae]SHG00955.1 hypothetical protein SAMN05444149_10877 [Pseudosulfitobacter pseudonitzschiae]